VPQTQSIPVVDLLLDQENARLGATQTSQQAVYLALAKLLKGKFVVLAQHIVDNGLDPMALPAVVATDAGRYRVLEGNRRVLALKALETPSIVKGGLPPAEQRKLELLAANYAEGPLDEIDCAVFDREEDAYPWIELRHTRAHLGASLESWDANEADRFKERKGRGSRDAAGQVLDFLDKVDGPAVNKGVISTLRRMLNNKSAREALGIVREDGQMRSHYPTAEVVKGLRRIVGDIRDKNIRTKDVYDAADIRAYVAGFSPGELPDPARRTPVTVPLTELQVVKPAPRDGRPKPPPKPKPKPPRTRSTLIPRECKINAPTTRLTAIYNELLLLNVDQFPNACAVTLRVFVELAVDHEVTKRPHLAGKADPVTTLAKRLKELATDMKSKGEIEEDLRKAVTRIADGRGMAASTMTFNQFVHNKYVHPTPSDLRTAWDELQPFMEKVLP